MEVRAVINDAVRMSIVHLMVHEVMMMMMMMTTVHVKKLSHAHCVIYCITTTGQWYLFPSSFSL